MFGSLGVPELLLIFVVVLIVFGPRRIPEIGRTLGKALGEFRRATDDLKSTIEREVRLEELKKVAPPTMESFLTPAASVSRSAPVDQPADGQAALSADGQAALSADETEQGAATSTPERLDDATVGAAGASTTPSADGATPK